jgi:hypothetical protein
MRARFARNCSEFSADLRATRDDLKPQLLAASRVNLKSRAELGLGLRWDPLTTRLGPPRGD